MKIKTVLLCTCVVLFTQYSPSWGGPILSTTSIIPSDLNTPLANPGKSYLYTYTGCVDASNGNFVNCDYDFTITGLMQPDTDPANNGGHTHYNVAHPLGYLRLGLWPASGTQSTSLSGGTQNNWVYFQHEIPQASGKIETVLNLRVPPGWYTVYPESCTSSGTSWCFNTTVDVGLNNLTPLPDVPLLYTKARKQNATALAHTDAVAFYGTVSALSNLSSIADWYDFLVFGSTILSINDMSLIKGGLFDVNGSYSSPHSWHRTGESVDINKDINGDCTKNTELLLSVYIVMGRNGGPIISNRQLPSFGHFLCETKNGLNRIHIDL